ncbi:hypothetical protein OCGS_1254 [Oceaniovalibus guishaninsula JLT2003]|uniref:Cytochrome C oxidase assembly protein n=1 Tax=Oceaniovalibus guishaninsula JLT2003 TaxID=1231392 RepID=K2GP01_9RHOB|nr:hypothetical protein [Oceaniovalibus guishaninsula]EKE44416.1 hypothetical protein OCGS_1254 [Oceaniovalibus guishaninsula JLT2003]
MAIRTEHALHRSRRSRNVGVGLVLVGFIAIIFGLTVVKVESLGETDSFDQIRGGVLLPGEEDPLK